MSDPAAQEPSDAPPAEGQPATAPAGRALAVGLALIALLEVLPLLLVVRWSREFSGPTRWLGTAEVWVFGSYDDALVDMVVYTLLFAMAVGLALLLRLGPLPDPGTRPRAPRWVRGLILGLVFFAFGATPGGYLLLRAWRAGALRSVDPAALARGELPPDPCWAEVSGVVHPETSAVLEVSHRTHHSRFRYAPLRAGASPGEEDRGPVAVVVESRIPRTHDEAWKDAHHVRLRGILSRGVTEYALGRLRAQQVGLAAEPWRLNVHESPADLRWEAAWWLGIFGGLGVFFAILAGRGIFDAQVARRVAALKARAKPR